MKSENKNIKTKSEKKKTKLPFRYIMQGNLLTEDFFIKQSGLVLLIFCLILVFISNRYFCSKKLTEMNNLKKELVRLQNEQVNLTFRLTRISRQSQIEELLKGKDIMLTKDSTTVYEIRK